MSWSSLHQDELQIPLDLSTIPTPKEFKASDRLTVCRSWSVYGV